MKISSILMIGMIGLYAMMGNLDQYIHPLLNFFLYSIPSNTAISLFPHEPVIIHLGKTYDPLILSIIGTLGTIVAGILDYFIFVPILTHQSSNSIRSSNMYEKIERWFSYKPFLTISIAGFTPIPFFPFKVLAFASRYPLPKYIGALVVGRFPRYFVLALIGYYFHIPGWMLVTVFVIIILTLLPGLSRVIKKAADSR